MSDSDNNFQDLKRLLKLKRHEVPPPGYFNHFSSDVVSRIRSGETGGAQSILGQFEGNSLMISLLQLFQAKPGIIGGFATSLCLLLLIGVVMAERPDGTSTAGDMSDMTGFQQVASENSGLAAVPLMPAEGSSGIAVSSNGVVSLQPSVAEFNSQQNPLFQRVGFTPGQ